MTRTTIQPAVMYAIVTAGLLLSITTGVRGQTGSGSSTQAQAPTQQPSPGDTQSANRATKTAWATLAWLDGRWQGNWGPRIAEQIWTAPKAGVMVGVFREIENDKTLVIELFSLLDTPNGIECRFRHFTPSLEPWETSDPTVLKLASADPTRIVFENPTDGKPKRVIFTRTGPDTYVARSEIVPDQGETQVTEITYRRQAPSGGSAGRR